MTRFVNNFILSALFAACASVSAATLAAIFPLARSYALLRSSSPSSPSPSPSSFASPSLTSARANASTAALVSSVASDSKRSLSHVIATGVASASIRRKSSSHCRLARRQRVLERARARRERRVVRSIERSNRRRARRRGRALARRRRRRVRATVHRAGASARASVCEFDARRPSNSAIRHSARASHGGDEVREHARRRAADDVRRRPAHGLAAGRRRVRPGARPTIDFKKILNSSYETLCVEILSVFCANGEEFTKETLREIAHEACKTFADDAIAPVKTLGRRGARGWVHACELHRGPTLSAEDASMQMAVRMMDRALKLRGKRGNVMCSTTGEEGGAFARVAAEMKNMDAWIVYPGDDGDVTEPQEREMTCHVEDHVHPVKVSECPDGMSDVDAVVIDVLNDEAFRLANGMVSANSANVARVLCFVPLFFHAYGQVRAKREEWGRPVVFSIPSSTFALEYAGHLARLMGLPITVVAACNANGAAHRAISLGELYKTDMVHTSSSALDVVVAENMWRSLYYALDQIR